MILADSINSKRKKSVQFQRNGYQDLIHLAPLFGYEKKYVPIMLLFGNTVR